MASTIVRALIEDATWESIQAQPYDGTRYPCGCHPHPTEPHLSFRLCDYHDGFDSGVDRGCHELQTEIERLRAAGDAMVQLICLNPNTPSQEDWDAAIAAWQEARREQ